MPSDQHPSSARPARPSAAGAPTEAPSAEPTLPDTATLLALEQQARRVGSQLQAVDLDGLWWLERVWTRGQTQPSSLAGTLLRGLGASLRIEVSVGREPAPPVTSIAPVTPPNPSASSAPSDPAALDRLQLTNAVRLGPLQLRFQGPGWLQGKRPLLLFQFDRLEIRLGDRLLLARSIPAPQSQRQPFFALIARGPGGQWLAARGRSGGLAVWRRDGGSGGTGS